MHRLALVAVIVGCTHAPPPSITPAAPSHTRLVVLLVIDQWPIASLQRDRHLFTGGLARLLREGSLATAELPYANTFTAPGHATIGTGVVPRVHGIVGNDWYRVDEGKPRPAEYDPASIVFSVGPADVGESLDPGVSGAALLVDGIADHQRGHGKSIAISIKPRSAVLMLGHHPDLAVWYDAGAGGMTTSSAYAREVPAWLVALAKAKPVGRFFKQTWQPLDAALLARETGLADDAPGEASEHDLGRVFPHRLALADSPSRAIQMTPFADEIVLDTALAALDAMDLGDDSVDLLAISFGAHDFAGHAWGPDSWEELDLTLRLDQQLGTLLAALDTRLGAGNYQVVLTSDHGATGIPERNGIAGARRIKPGEIEAAVGADKVKKLISQNLYLAPGTDLDAAVAAASTVPQLARVVRTDRLCPAEPLLCNSFVPGRGGQVYVIPQRGSLVTDYPTGTHHDAPFEDNRFVPVIATVPLPEKMLLTDVAPLVEKLLGLPAFPRERVGKPWR